MNSIWAKEIIKGILKNLPTLRIVLSCHQRWIRFCGWAYRTFWAFLGRIPFEAPICRFGTQACYTCKALNTLMSMDLRTLSVWRSDPALTLCTIFGWERRGILHFVPTCYWLHDLPISHFLWANSPLTQFHTHLWTLSCSQMLRPESQPPSTRKSKARLEVHSL